MAQAKQTNFLNRLVNKTVLFSGNFPERRGFYGKALALAQQARVIDKLDATVDYLVVSDLSTNKAVQTKAAALNAKNAAIHLLDLAQFEQLTLPSDEELLAIIRADRVQELRGLFESELNHPSEDRIHPKALRAADFRNSSFAGLKFYKYALLNCQLANVRCNDVHFQAVADCDFTGAELTNVWFDDVMNRNCFVRARLAGVHFRHYCRMGEYYGLTNKTVPPPRLLGGVVYQEWIDNRDWAAQEISFVDATLTACQFDEMHYAHPDFSGALLRQVVFKRCGLTQPKFVGATLDRVNMIASKFTQADFTNADLTGTNFAYADLTGATFHGANLTNVNLRGANLTDVDLSQAKNVSPAATVAATRGPALLELDQVASQAQRIEISFNISEPGSAEVTTVSVDSSNLGWGGWSFRSTRADEPPLIAERSNLFNRQKPTLSQALLYLGDVAGLMQLHWESINVVTIKSPLSGKALGDLVTRAIGEAFAQTPTSDKKAGRGPATSKTPREVAKQERAAARAALAQARAEEAAQLAQAIQQAVGTVNDYRSFLQVLGLRFEKPKLTRATKMLQASGFQLYNDATSEFVSGVVKSQTDPDLVYACRITGEGEYGCCSQHLNVCGGLRGSICKHLLVLLIGLVQAGQLDAATIDEWIAKTKHKKEKVDKEIMAAIFLKYKGAEAGEIDWRPTETLPEDYYAL